MLHKNTSASASETTPAIEERADSISRGSSERASDRLTGLNSRDAGLDRLRELWAHATRHGEPLSCLLISVDQVRTINDLHGVEAGDHALREVTRVLRAFARTEEHLCRLCGNEFLVMCPKSTARNAAIGAERQRWAVQSSAVMWEHETLHLTVSIGVAERSDEMSRIDQLIANAGEAMVVARQSGGNRVRVADGGDDGNVAADPTAAVISSDDAAQPAHRAILIHDEGDNNFAALCTQLSRWGFAVERVERTMFDPVAHAVDPSTVIVAAIGDDIRSWHSVIRTIRSSSATRRAPVIIYTDPALEPDAAKLAQDGASAFIATSDPQRTVRQTMLSLIREARLEHQLVENQSMRAEQARMLTALFDLARSFASADSLERCLERLMHIACEMLQVGRVAILVSNRDRSGMSRAVCTDGSVVFEELDRASLEGGVIEQVCRKREATLIEDLASHAAHMTDVERMLFDGAPVAIAPMVTAQRIVGVLVACEKPAGSGFKPWEVAMLDLLSNIAAASIDDHHARTARDDAREAIVVALAKLTQHRDGPTAEHVDRVSRICVALARELARTVAEQFPEIDDAFITNLEWAVPLHDIGKVGLPDSILLKPGRLTDEEMEIMRSHVEIGQSALHSVSMRVPEAEYLRMAERIAHFHHEWFDGTGYPTGLSGEDIPLAARIASVADAYDAITSSRCYKKAVAHDAACEEISKRAGSQFDPRIVAAFERCKHLIAGPSEGESAAQSPSRADAA